ncbi:hypothetical protein A2V82_16415 [candidate division KSB1 bacterium RBG_16_48_16]|nr:MAG: hypothetical protein A2V82_16415 [candidate division KSB1 bacterium RBG_16_48_16]
MILGFSKQFVAPILIGIKIHTIREDKKGRWKAGTAIHMATSVRTKQYQCFSSDYSCKGTQFIDIRNFGEEKEVWVGGRELTTSEIELLAKNDGFKDVAAFWRWFPLDFSGKIIHWTDFRYEGGC